MIPRIKICGVTWAEDIALCEELGVDYIGLNFVPTSPRYLSSTKAAAIRSKVRSTKVVGVFVDEELEEVQSHAERLLLDCIQLHGGESVEYVRSLSLPVIKAFRAVPPLGVLRAFLDAGAWIMFDGRANGQQADWDAISTLPSEVREHFFLAGGLIPGNVQRAIEKIHPFAVDVASGVESEAGLKDPELLRGFVDAVRASTRVSTREDSSVALLRRAQHRSASSTRSLDAAQHDDP